MTTTLFDAFVAGFNLSSEGYNAEYPYGVGSDEERKIKDLRQMYEEWMKETSK